MRTLLLLVVVSCGPRNSAAPPTPVRPVPTPDAAAVVVIDAAPPDAPIAAATPPPDPLADKSAEEQWAWAVSLVPELGTLASVPDGANFDRLGIKGGKITLYASRLEVTNLTKPLTACTALPLELDNGRLVTRIAPDSSRIRQDLGKNYVELDVGATVDDIRFEDGQQVGQGDGPISGYLSEVTPRGLRYDGSGDRLHAICQKNVTRRDCSDGSKQACERCTPTVVSQFQRSGVTVAVSSPKPVDCTPCPPDPITPTVLEALNRVLLDHRVMRVEEGTGPAFYVRQADCKAALRKKPAATKSE